jgi:Cu/Ag efflux protein CusF
MTRRSFVSAWVAPVVVALVAAWCGRAAATPSTAQRVAFWSAIHATVVSVDRKHKTLTIRHEALETVPAGVRVCAVRDSRSLEHVHAGSIIEARAETSHAEWLLEGIHIVGRTGSRAGASPFLAAR